jgi:hypothetical protein
MSDRSDDNSAIVYKEVEDMLNKNKMVKRGLSEIYAELAKKFNLQDFN